MEGKALILQWVRFVLVVLAFILMLAVVIFQYFEADHYGINVTERLFSSSETASDSKPADNAEQTADNAEQTEKEAPAAVKDDNTDEAATQE